MDHILNTFEIILLNADISAEYPIYRFKQIYLNVFFLMFSVSWLLSEDMLTIQLEHYVVSYLSRWPYLQFFERKKHQVECWHADMLTCWQYSCPNWVVLKQRHSVSYLLSTSNFLFNSLLDPKRICNFQTKLHFRPETMLQHSSKKANNTFHFDLMVKSTIFKTYFTLPSIWEPSSIPRPP